MIESTHNKKKFAALTANFFFTLNKFYPRDCKFTSAAPPLFVIKK